MRPLFQVGMGVVVSDGLVQATKRAQIGSLQVLGLYDAQRSWDKQSISHNLSLEQACITIASLMKSKRL